MRLRYPLLGLVTTFLVTSHLPAAPRISEFMASNDSTLADVDGDYSDWIEIHNAGSTAVDLGGYHLTDDVDELTRWTLPPMNLGADQRLVVFASGKDRTDPGAELHTDFQLSASGEYLAIVAPDGVTVMTEFAPVYPPQFEDQSYGQSTFAPANATVFVDYGASANYLIPEDGSLALTWTGQTFDDASWGSGTSGFGWENVGQPIAALVQTDIEAEMRNTNATSYFRFPFNFDTSSGAIQTLSLTMQAEDAFIAYLNGAEVARGARVPAGATWNSSATGAANETQVVQSPPTFDLSAQSTLITDGENVLAIHGMNVTTSSSDFLIRPNLFADVQNTSGDLLSGYYETPSPGSPDSSGNGSGPIFVDFTDKPERPVAGTDLVVTAEMQGSNADTSSVTLFYRIMYDGEIELAMSDDGTGGDAIADDGTYSATIPGSAFGAGEMIRWRFVATDALGFVTDEPRFPDPLDSHQYVGTVAVDPAVESYLPVVELFVPNMGAAGTTAGTRGNVFYLGELYDNIFLNRHGQSTGGFPKKSHNLDFNKTQRFRWHPDEKRVKDIDLLTNWADKSKVRHVLSWEIMRESGVAGHFAFTTRVQNNGEFFSTADFVEDADDIYLERAGLNPDGSLYKVYNNTLSAGNSTISPAVERKNGDSPNGQDLADFIAGLNTGTTDEQWDFIYDNVNLPMCVNMAAANCVIRNTDMHRKNWYIYRDSGRTDEWGLLPWDLDLAHGRKWNSAENYFDHQLYSDGVTRVGTAVRLISMMWARPDTREMMRRRIRTLSDRFLSTPDTPYGQRWFERRIDEQSALIDPPEIVPSDARLDFIEWGSWIEGSSAQVPYTSTHLHVEDMAEGVARFKDEYLPGRRTNIYGHADVPAPQSGEPEISYVDLAAADAPLNYFFPTDASLGTSWTALAFDDAAWNTGIGGIGYGGSNYTSLIGENVGTEMRDNHAGAYVRIPFQVSDPASLAALELQIQADDAFIAYINGTEVARDSRVPAGADWDSNATAANNPEDELIANPPVFDLSAHLDKLSAGSNVLAIHGMNDRTTSSDFLIRTVLRAGTLGDISPEPTIDFGAIEFKPASNNQEEEFIELVNNNAIAVDVSDWTISGGIDFVLPGGTVIPSGGSLYLSPDVKAFRARATSPTGGEKRFVVGPYSGHLSNLGETLELSDQNGSLNNNTSYAGAPSDAQLYLVVSEVMYHPADNGLAEFIEVLNISDTVTVDLTGLTFTGAFTFDFTGAAVTTLAPGERVLVVRDMAAFEASYGAGLPVAGVFSGGTALGNGGEEIKFEDAENGTIREFNYDDNEPWPTAADGGGSSLVLIDPLTAADHDLASSWRAGSPAPGAPDPSGFTGDPTADLDGDGLNALLEYALGTDDTNSASGSDAFFVGFDADSATFSYRRNLAANDLTYAVETSTDLENWSTAGLSELSRVDNGDTTETVTMKASALLADEERRQFRLRVNQ